MGRLLVQEAIPWERDGYALDTRALLGGCYYVTITDANGTGATARFVKE
jgi:hypothetical protein